MKHARRSVPAGRPIRLGVRLRNDVPSWRRLPAITREALAALALRVGIRVRKSWNADRVLWIEIEASSKETLTAAMRGLGVRVAKAVNAKLQRQGPVLADRYELVIPPAVSLGRRVADAILQGTEGVAQEASRGRGPPLLAAGKVALAVALTPLMLRSMLPPIGGRRRSAADMREIRREEDKAMRGLHEEDRQRARRRIKKANQAYDARLAYIVDFRRGLERNGWPYDEAELAARDLDRDLRASADADRLSLRRLAEWREAREDAREERAQRAAPEKAPWWRFWR